MPDFEVDAESGTFAAGHYVRPSVRRYATLPFRRQDSRDSSDTASWGA